MRMGCIASYGFLKYLHGYKHVFVCRASCMLVVLFHMAPPLPHHSHTQVSEYLGEWWYKSYMEKTQYLSTEGMVYSGRFIISVAE